MFRRSIQQALWLWLACAGLVVPAQAAAGEEALTPPLFHPMGEGSSPAGTQYRITHWTTANGLPQNSIKALVQTRDGYLWVGTLKGLARFDGVRFKVFDHSSTPEMTHDSINDLAVDEKDGGLWIGTGAGLLYCRDHRFERHGQQEGITGQVGPLCPAREGGVWFSPRAGQVALAHAARMETWEFGPERAENIVHQLVEESPSQLLALLGSASGSCKLDRLVLKTKSLMRLSVPRVEPREEPPCYSFLQDANEILWLCTSEGIWHGSEKSLDADHQHCAAIGVLAAGSLSNSRWRALGHAVRRRSQQPATAGARPARALYRARAARRTIRHAFP